MLKFYLKKFKRSKANIYARAQINIYVCLYITTFPLYNQLIYNGS